MSKRLHWALYFVFLLLAILVSAEVTIRLYRFTAFSPGDRQYIEYWAMMANRIRALWISGNTALEFAPPFKVFANVEIDDQDRLRHVFEDSREPRNTQIRAYDFLQNERLASVSQYVMHFNSLGFRGSEHAIIKPPNVFRIIALGSYHTLGHGLNDNETYCAKLEEELNRSPLSNRSYEVWNGGRHASTAIVGLARLHNEVLDYKPDMLILDYGFPGDVIADNFIPNSLRFPDSQWLLPIKAAARGLIPVIGNSVVLSELLDKLYQFDERKNHVAFLQTMRLMVEHAWQRHIPVVLLSQLPAVRFDPEFQAEMAPKGAVIVETEQAFRERPPTSLDWQEMSLAPNWFSEVPPQAQRYFPYAPYMLSALQLNRKGQSVLAHALVTKVRECERL